MTATARELFEAHRWFEGVQVCRCDPRLGREPMSEEAHRAHLADVIDAWHAAELARQAERIATAINPQPRYPFEFVQADAIEYVKEQGHEFDAIHASPPCQSHLNLRKVNQALGRTDAHLDLIAPTRDALEATGLPYVIENVQDARPELVDPVRICGTAFNLPLRRHRLFESNVPIVGKACEHHRFTEPKFWTGWRPKGEHRLSTVVQVYGNAGGVEHWPAAMGIDWMDRHGLTEAIPPAYTEHIGHTLMEHLTHEALRGRRLREPVLRKGLVPQALPGMEAERGAR